MEIWRPIKGYDFSYEVSNYAIIRSLSRRSKYRTSIRKLKGRIVSQNIVGNGYMGVNLTINGLTNSRTVHQLVAVAFLDHTPCGYKLIVDHIDNDKLNNHVDNLQLITARENTSKDARCASSNYIGVTWNKFIKKWVSQIKIKGKTIYLGSFKLEVDAANAYKIKLDEIN